MSAMGGKRTLGRSEDNALGLRGAPVFTAVLDREPLAPNVVFPEHHLRSVVARRPIVSILAYKTTGGVDRTSRRKQYPDIVAIRWLVYFLPEGVSAIPFVHAANTQIAG